MGAQIFTRRPARNNSPGSFPGHTLIPSPSPLIYHHQPVRHLEKNHKTPGPGSAGWGRLRGAAQPSPARLGGARLRSPHAGSCRWDGPARLRSAPLPSLSFAIIALRRRPGVTRGRRHLPAWRRRRRPERLRSPPRPWPSCWPTVSAARGGRGCGDGGAALCPRDPRCCLRGPGWGSGGERGGESGAARCLGCCLHGRDRPLPPVLSPVPAPVPLPAPAPCPCLPGALPVFPCSSW